MIEYADSAGVPARRHSAVFRRRRRARARATPAATAGPAPSTRYERECVQTILSGIARAGERYGRYRIVAMLVGDTGDLPPALDRSLDNRCAPSRAVGCDPWLD